MHQLSGEDFVPRPPKKVAIKTQEELAVRERQIAQERQGVLAEANAGESIYLTEAGEETNPWCFLDSQSNVLVPSIAQQVCWRKNGENRERVYYTDWGWVSGAEMQEARRRYRADQRRS